MKQTVFVSVAVWVIERTTPARVGEALAGDLLEELHAGRSAGWYWRQVLLALLQTAAATVRPYAGALLFSAVWTAIWPWAYARCWGQVLPAEVHRWSALPWPYSSLLVVTGELLPTISCIGLGMIVYLVMFADGWRARPSVVRAGASASLGVNVSLVMGACLFAVPGVVPAGPHLVVSAPVLLGGQSPLVALALLPGLWVATLCATWPRRATQTPTSAAV